MIILNLVLSSLYRLKNKNNDLNIISNYMATRTNNRKLRCAIGKIERSWSLSLQNFMGKISFRTDTSYYSLTPASVALHNSHNCVQFHHHCRYLNVSSFYHIVQKIHTYFGDNWIINWVVSLASPGSEPRNDTTAHEPVLRLRVYLFLHKYKFIKANSLVMYKFIKQTHWLSFWSMQSKKKNILCKNINILFYCNFFI